MTIKEQENLERIVAVEKCLSSFLNKDIQLHAMDCYSLDWKIRMVWPDADSFVRQVVKEYYDRKNPNYSRR